MSLLLIALLIGLVGVVIFSGGILLGRLLATVLLFRPLSLGLIQQIRTYLPSLKQMMHPKQTILYLRHDAAVTFVFFGTFLIIVAAAMIAISVFGKVLA